MYMYKFFREKADAPDYDCRENCELKYYENVDAAEFSGWIDALSKDGFDVLQKNEINSNLFFLLKNDNILLTALFTPCDKTLRVTASSNVAVPMLEKCSYTGECETKFYCFENDHSIIDCGMCLLVQCSDYSFFVVDSGHYFQFNDNDRIYKFMRERTPDGKKVVVSGWFVTHAHTDHISKLIDFLKYNCNDVIIEGFYSNLLPYEYEEPNWDIEEKLISKKLFDLMDRCGIPKYKLHTGERFYIRNLAFDVLGTHEDVYPQHIRDYNDSSCIVMMEADGTRVFIPGDAAVKASELLEKRFDNSLKCDVVQVAHHGHIGLSSHAYELLNAKIAVFPITRIKFDEEYPRIEANRRLIELADGYYISSDGTVEISMKTQKVRQHDDETFEDFEKIRRQWGYTYTDERKKELYEIYLEHGGNLDKEVLPAWYKGFSIY